MLIKYNIKYKYIMIQIIIWNNNYRIYLYTIHIHDYILYDQYIIMHFIVSLQENIN